MTGQSQEPKAAISPTTAEFGADPLAKLVEAGGAQNILSVEQTQEILRDTQRFIKEVLVRDQDYDVTIKDRREIRSLNKPGAEKLRLKFRLGVKFEVLNRVLDWDHKVFYFEVLAVAIHVPSGAEMGRFIAACHSREDKYRFRWLTSKKLPPNTDKANLVSETRGKRGDEYTVYRMDNQNPEDQINTYLQMAEKRAFVGVIRMATCTSDQFTAEIGGGNGDTEPGRKLPQRSRTGDPQRAEGASPVPSTGGGSEDSVKDRVYKHFGGDEEAVQDFLRTALKATGTIPLDNLPAKQLEKVNKALRDLQGVGAPGSVAGRISLGMKNVILLSLKSRGLTDADRAEIRAKLDCDHPHLVTDRDVMTEAEAEHVVRSISYKEDVATTREALRARFPDEKAGLAFAAGALGLDASGKEIDIEALSSEQLLRLREALDKAVAGEGPETGRKTSGQAAADELF